MLRAIIASSSLKTMNGKALIVTLLSIALLPSFGIAQTPNAAPTEQARVDPLGRSSPRSAVFNFLRTAREGNYAAACSYLETRGKPYAPGNPIAAELAKKLQAVLDSRLNVNLADISDDAGGRADDGLEDECGDAVGP